MSKASGGGSKPAACLARSGARTIATSRGGNGMREREHRNRNSIHPRISPENAEAEHYQIGSSTVRLNAVSNRME